MRTLLIALTLALSLLVVSCSDNGTDSNASKNHPAGLLYVLNQGDNSIYVYDTKTLQRIDSIDSKVIEPHFIEFSPDRKYFYVTTLETTGHIAKFNAQTHVFIDSVRTPPNVNPSAIAITNNGQYGYVCNFALQSERSRITKYDLETLDSVGSFQAGALSHDLQATSDGLLVLVTNRFSEEITYIDTQTDLVDMVSIDPDTVYPILGNPKYGPFGIIIDNDDSLAYVACADGKQVRVLEIAAKTVIDSVNIPSDSIGPTLLAISPDNSHVFVSTKGGNSVVVVQTSPLQVVKEIFFETIFPFGIDVSDDGSRVYVACNGTAAGHGRVYVIDANSFQIIDSLDVGNRSFGLRYQPPKN